MDLGNWYAMDAKPTLMNERTVRQRLGADVVDRCQVLSCDELAVHPLCELMGKPAYVGREVEADDCWVRGVLCPDLTGAGDNTCDYRILFFEVRWF